MDKKIRIHKYEMKFKDKGKIKISGRVLKILNVGEQGEKLFIWVVVKTDDTPCFVHYKIKGTGDAVHIDTDNFLINFFKTVQMENGLVWHISIDPKTTEE